MSPEIFPEYYTSKRFRINNNNDTWYFILLVYEGVGIIFTHDTDSVSTQVGPVR